MKKKMNIIRLGLKRMFHNEIFKTYKYLGIE